MKDCMQESIATFNDQITMTQAQGLTHRSHQQNEIPKESYRESLRCQFKNDEPPSEMENDDAKSEISEVTAGRMEIQQKSKIGKE